MVVSKRLVTSKLVCFLVGKRAIQTKDKKKKDLLLEAGKNWDLFQSVCSPNSKLGNSQYAYDGGFDV